MREVETACSGQETSSGDEDYSWFVRLSSVFCGSSFLTGSFGFLEDVGRLGNIKSHVGENIPSSFFTNFSSAVHGEAVVLG